jgi:hypothetical protein
MKKVIAFIQAKTQTKLTHTLIMLFVSGFTTSISLCFSGDNPHFPTEKELLIALAAGVGLAFGYIGKNIISGTGIQTQPNE